MRFFLRFLLRRMGGVPFLPEELGRAQEQPGAHLPADDVAPLIDEQRQIAIALDPVLVGVPDDRLGGGPDDQRLFELGVGIDDQPFAGDRLEPMMRDDGAFLGEALGHLLFLGEERLGDEQRKVGVDVAGVLEHAVEGPLHLLPDGVAVRLDDHAAAHVGVLRQAGVLDDVEIPLRVIVAAFGDRFGHAWVLR